jgi:hypothetical protein
LPVTTSSWIVPDGAQGMISTLGLLMASRLQL